MDPSNFKELLESATPQQYDSIAAVMWELHDGPAESSQGKALAELTARLEARGRKYVPTPYGLKTAIINLEAVGAIERDINLTRCYAITSKLGPQTLPPCPWADDKPRRGRPPKQLDAETYDQAEAASLQPLTQAESLVAIRRLVDYALGPEVTPEYGDMAARLAEALAENDELRRKVDLLDGAVLEERRQAAVLRRALAATNGQLPALPAGTVGGA